MIFQVWMAGFESLFVLKDIIYLFLGLSPFHCAWHHENARYSIKKTTDMVDNHDMSVRQRWKR